MAPEPWPARALRTLALIVATQTIAPSPAEALRIVNYNIMFYPSVNVAGRNPYFQIVMSPLGADVVVVQELNNVSGIAQFRDNVLNVIEPGQWSAAPYTSGPDSNNGLFYKAARCSLLGSWAWIPPDNLRQVNCYRLRPAGYTNTELRVYSLHLKAGDTSTDEARRLTDAIGIRDSLNAIPPGTHVILTGDFNVYRSTDNAFEKFLESQVDNDGRLYDPLNAIGEWQDNAALAPIHTQCPSTTSYRPSGSYSGGGVDDRFDMFLPTFNMNDGEGLDLLVSTYIPVGNDGQHLNKAVTEPPIAPSDTAYARALWWASDHLPIRVDIQLPAKISAPASLAVGDVIVGGGGNLTISNPAQAPADELNITFTPPAGFTAPPNGIVAVGASTPFAIGTAAGAPGARNGNLTLGTDAPDNPTVQVALSANVLDHAEASLDSLATVTEATLDFGQHPAGGFTTMLARVHNRVYDALQARLALGQATIADGDGRFSIVGGFSPVLVAGTAQSYPIAFDDNGAQLDVTYQGTLVFVSDDEPLPGALGQPNLEVTLTARVTSGAVGTSGSAPPPATRLYAPTPNPLRGSSRVRFDLAAAAEARLEVFDLSGRRVAQLAGRRFEPGRYEFTWDGRDAESGAAAAGLYFVRLIGPSLAARTVRLVVVR